MSDSERAYWKKHYRDDSVVGGGDPQRNVGRTRGGMPVADEVWKRTLNDIKELLSIDKSVEVVELCCGNGEVIGNLAAECKHATGVDYSRKLLRQMESKFGSLVEPIYADVLEVEFKPESTDVIIIYFSIQHFDERETVRLVERCLKWLRKGGKLFIGDIPNDLKKWEYIDKPAYRRDYIERVVKGTPMIGNWFQPQFFEALSSYFDDITVEVIEQPSYHINSSYRFDVLIGRK